MSKSIKIFLSILAATLLIVLVFISFWLYQHYNVVEQVEQEYVNYAPPELTEFGSTTQLSILPLINWHHTEPELKTEMGVSYLVKTDSVTILFDLGHNPDEENPSPLEHNMSELDISLEDIDMIFISHNHFDHVGGPTWVDRKSFSLGTEQKDLTGKLVYTPVEMDYPGIEPVHIPEPQVIGHGLASTGTIPRKLVMGRIDEQALVVNVEGKGLVLIVGCGHQTLPKIIERTEEVFDQSIYGVIGDLHYPVPEGRLSLLGINAQRFFASGDGPFHPLTREEVEQSIELLESVNPGIVGVGGHDTSDEVIEKFRNTFGSKYRYVKVGNWIRIDS